MSHHYEPSKASEKSAPHTAKSRGNQLHRKWWFWLAVVLMLGAMIVYGLATPATIP